MKRIFTLLLWLSVMVVSVQAQGVKFGLKGGLDVTDMKFNRDVFDSSNKIGWFIGPTVRVSLPVPGLGLDISGLYNQREAKVEETTGTGTTTLKQKQIVFPVNVRYAFGLGSLANVYVFAGPQAGFNVGDSEKSLFDNVAEWRLKDSNFSVNVGFGFVVSHVQVSANYNAGVGKTGEATWKSSTQAAEDGWNGHYNAWQIAFAYFF